MPRRARIDAAGALQHIICRGIQRCRIYRDDLDRQYFLERLRGRSIFYALFGDLVLVISQHAS
jgi:hypothetical protein